MNKYLLILFGGLGWMNCLAISGNEVSASELGTHAAERAVIAMLSSEYSPHGSDGSTYSTVNCGGVLLETFAGNFIITALHCLDKLDYVPKEKNHYRFMVREVDVMLPWSLNPLDDIRFANDLFILGLMYQQLAGHFVPNDSYVINYRKVSAIYLPADDELGFTPDIAVYKLDDSLPFNPVLVQIPSATPDLQGTTVYGWGYDVNAPPNLAAGGYLRVSPATNPSIVVAKSEIETFNYGCDTDSGGPLLVAAGYGTYWLLGIASYVEGGNKMAEECAYIHYQMVSRYASWLNLVLAGKLPASCRLGQYCELGESQP